MADRDHDHPDHHTGEQVIAQPFAAVRSYPADDWEIPIQRFFTQNFFKHGTPKISLNGRKKPPN
jgi:hypothetical protein